MLSFVAAFKFAKKDRDGWAVFSVILGLICLAAIANGDAYWWGGWPLLFLSMILKKKEPQKTETIVIQNYVEPKPYYHDEPKPYVDETYVYMPANGKRMITTESYQRKKQDGGY